MQIDSLKADKKSCNPAKLTSKPGLQGPNTFWQSGADGAKSSKRQMAFMEIKV
ncbi:MAG TPA: hypothetical protein VFS97_04270 [Nitrososphaeraceae archaeon]|nr:hypothetical protein [Nitrososphaeraceae archaeon]